MKKRLVRAASLIMFSFALALAAAGLCSDVHAAADAFTYADAPGGIVLTGYSGRESELVIPGSIDGKKVVAIGEGCFSCNDWINKVTVPEGVVSIGDYAFECCSLMESITLPDSVVSIGNGAFSGCGGLTSVSLGSGLTTIGDGAFMACLSLREIELPENVEELGKYVFSTCDSLQSVTFKGNSLTEIPERAFHGCGGLDTITLPDSIKTIGRRAFFSDMYLLLQGGAKFKEIGDYAFTGVQRTTDPTDPEQKRLDYLGRHLGEYLDDGCTLGFGILAGNELDRYYASRSESDQSRYRSCFSWEDQVCLPASTIISAGTFYGSPISGIRFSDSDDGSPQYTLVDGCLYTDGGHTLLAYFPKQYDPETQGFVSTAADESGVFEVPEGVTRIAPYAFFNCMLKEVRLPDSAAVIEDNAFTRSGVSTTQVYKSGRPVDASVFGNIDSAFYKWDLDEPSDTEEDPSGKDPDTYTMTSLAGGRSLYRAEDFASYTSIYENFSEWCREYIEINKTRMPMDKGLAAATYNNLYKGGRHFYQMVSALNHDPEWVDISLQMSGHDYEEMYLMMDHGLSAELGRCTTQGDLLLYSGVTQFVVEQVAGAAPGTTVTTDDLIDSIGSIYTEKGFTSTAASYKTSYSFCRDSKVMFFILASHESMDSLGTFCIDCFQGAAGSGGVEYEILFNRDARFQVLDVGIADSGEGYEPRTYVLVKLLAPGEDPYVPSGGRASPQEPSGGTDDDGGGNEKAGREDVVTGDGSLPAGWLVLMSLSAAGLGMLFLKRRTR